MVVHNFASKLMNVNIGLIDEDLKKIKSQTLNKKEYLYHASELCKDNSFIHPEWSILAGKVRMASLKIDTPHKFSISCHFLTPALEKNYCNFVKANSKRLNNMIVHDRDYNFDIYAVDTLIHMYLARLKHNDDTTIYETPQYMYLRVATFLWYEAPGLDEEEFWTKIETTYHNLSTQVYTLGSPVFFNSGLIRHQLSSCFTLTIEDNFKSITKNWVQTGIISKNYGGFGCDFTSLRHSGIGHYGETRGVIPWIKILDDIIVAADQCFHPQTIVYSLYNGPKYIKDVKVGEQLIRSDGNGSTISKIIHHKIDKMQKFFSLTIEGYKNPVIVSSAHPLLSFSSQNEDKIISRIKFGQIQPAYIDTVNIDTTYYIGTPIPKYQDDDAHHYNYKMYGYILGSIVSDSPDVMVLELERFALINMKRFLVKSNVKFSIEYDPSVSRVIIPSQFSFPFSGVSTNNFITVLLHTKLSNISQIINGFRYAKGVEKLKSNDDLYEYIRYMLLRIGMMYNSTTGDFENIKVIHDGVAWFKVQDKSVIKDIDSAYVLDLEMKVQENVDPEITANYMTSLGMAHNGGKRKGAGNCYLCDWHIDIEEFIDLKKNSGAEEMRARNMVYSLFISDEFMRRVQYDENWTLFCPKYAEGLENVWGVKFEIAYKALEKKTTQPSNCIIFRTVRARELWQKIILTQIEIGMPFIHFKDSCNRKSNQRNLGTIRLGNLCCEILLFTDKNNIGTCQLGSIGLTKCVTDGKVDYGKIEYYTRCLVRDINQIIDRNYYSPEIPESKNSTMKNRPIGIGIQGLADLFAILDITWLSSHAKEINKNIVETMYYAAIDESILMAKDFGAYENFQGSPASCGKFQFDLWDEEKVYKKMGKKAFRSEEYLSESTRIESTRYDWSSLRREMMKHGLRNSLLLAMMPTATSAFIMGNNESYEPFNQNIYTRTILAGQYLFVNKYLVQDLADIGLWNTETLQNIWQNGGSAQYIDAMHIHDSEILDRLAYIKQKYLTAYELPQKLLLDMALDRGRYVCQSQSHNCFMKDPSYAKLNAYHFHAWMNGAKTGMYYLRTLAGEKPINMALNTVKIPVECSGDVCYACS